MGKLKYHRVEPPTLDLDDAVWFHINPGRSFRLRPKFPGEVFPVGTDFRIPRGYAAWVITQQIIPGLRCKHLVRVDPVIAGDAPDSETLVRAMYELLIANPTSNDPVSVAAVCELALKYCREKMN